MAVDVEAASFTRHVQGAADAERQSRRLLRCVGVNGFSAVVTETKGERPHLAIADSQARSTKHFVRGSNTSARILERGRSRPRGSGQRNT